MARPEIQTRRLRLAPLRAADASAFFGYRANPEVSRYQSFEPRSLDDAEKFIGGLQSVVFDTPDSWFQFGIHLQDSEVLIGDLGVHFMADNSAQVEIGVTVAPAHQAQGYATEAVTGLLWVDDVVFGMLREEWTERHA